MREKAKHPEREQTQFPGTEKSPAVRDTLEKCKKRPQDHHHQDQNKKKQVRYEKSQEVYLINMPLKLRDMILNLKVN